jgi:hypothetical protein
LQGFNICPQREKGDIRRKVKAETRLTLLSGFKEHKNKIDDLTDKLAEALERMQ